MTIKSFLDTLDDYAVSFLWHKKPCCVFDCCIQKFKCIPFRQVILLLLIYQAVVFSFTCFFLILIKGHVDDVSFLASLELKDLPGEANNTDVFTQQKEYIKLDENQLRLGKERIININRIVNYIAKDPTVVDGIGLTTLVIGFVSLRLFFFSLWILLTYIIIFTEIGSYIVLLAMGYRTPPLLLMVAYLLLLLPKYLGILYINNHIWYGTEISLPCGVDIETPPALESMNCSAPEICKYKHIVLKF